MKLKKYLLLLNSKKIAALTCTTLLATSIGGTLTPNASAMKSIDNNISADTIVTKEQEPSLEEARQLSRLFIELAFVGPIPNNLKRRNLLNGPMDFIKIIREREELRRPIVEKDALLSLFYKPEYSEFRFTTETIVIREEKTNAVILHYDKDSNGNTLSDSGEYTVIFIKLDDHEQIVGLSLIHI